MAHAMKYFQTTFLFTLLVILFSGSPVHSENDVKECLSCHDKTYNRGIMKAYIHQPFLDKQCLTCHVERNDRNLHQSSRKSSSKRTKQKISWLQKHYEPAKTHFFLLPSDNIYEKLYVQIKGENNKSRVLSLPLPPIDKVSKLSNDGIKPRVSKIIFHGIKRGVLYSATISWETDKPSTAQILYGIGKFNKKSNLDTQLKTKHTISISPINPKKVYSYTVVSTDVHGNKTISQPMTFSASTPAVPLAAGNPARSASPDGKGLKYEIRALDNLYFVTITAPQPTHMGIGKNNDLRPRISIQAKDNGQEDKPATHVPLTNTRETNITACLKCHTDYQTESSHPIDVGPKPGMTFPDDYPVFDDGRMHCMTCHDAHSSRNEARIRRPTKQELCIGCHKSYG